MIPLPPPPPAFISPANIPAPPWSLVSSTGKPQPFIPAKPQIPSSFIPQMPMRQQASIPPWDWSQRPSEDTLRNAGALPFDIEARNFLAQYPVNPSFLDPWLQSAKYYRIPSQEPILYQGQPFPNVGSLYYGGEKPMIVTWRPDAEGIFHETTHGFADRYGMIDERNSWRRPAEIVPLYGNGGFVGAVKQLALDPQYADTQVGKTARHFAFNDATNFWEMYASLASASRGDLNQLPPSLRGFYAGFLSPFPQPVPRRIPELPRLNR